MAQRVINVHLTGTGPSSTSVVEVPITFDCKCIGLLGGYGFAQFDPNFDVVEFLGPTLADGFDDAIVIQSGYSGTYQIPLDRGRSIFVAGYKGTCQLLLDDQLG
jgi:hypothetical protein